MDAAPNGKVMHVATVWRWMIDGKSVPGKGTIKLRSILVGGLRCTSDEWAMAFFSELTGEDKPLVTRETPNRRARRIEAASKRLQASGI